jgi:branched-chain amino acid transport system permease protein
MLVAAIVGYPMLRTLGSDFLALATLGMSQVVFVLLRTVAPGGMAGMAVTKGLHTPLQGVLGNDADVLAVALLFFIGAVVAVIWIRSTRIGKLAHAARMDEHALAALGHDPVMVKTQVFSAAAFLAAFSGATVAHYLGAVEPRMASIQQTILILCGTILSGRGSVFGVLLGAAFVVVVPEILQSILSSGSESSWRAFPAAQIVYGCLVIATAAVLFPARLGWQRHSRTTR